MAAGRVIVLNGTSSAGKSTLASTLQRRFVDQGECWIIMGVDDMFLKLPPDWIRIRDFLGAHAEEGIAFETINGEVERRVEVRMERQEVLRGDNPLQLWGIVDEAALRV